MSDGSDVLRNLFNVNIESIDKIEFNEETIPTILQTIKENVLKLVETKGFKPLNRVHCSVSDLVQDRVFLFKATTNPINSRSKVLEDECSGNYTSRSFLISNNFFQSVEGRVQYQHYISENAKILNSVIRQSILKSLIVSGLMQNRAHGFVNYMQEYRRWFGKFNELEHDLDDFHTLITQEHKNLKTNSQWLLPTTHDQVVEIKGVEIVECKVGLGITEAPILKSVVQLGSYYCLLGYEALKNVATFEKYGSSWWWWSHTEKCTSDFRDIQIKHKLTKNWETLTWLDCLHESMRFDEYGKLCKVHLSQCIKRDMFKFSDDDRNLHVVQTWSEVELEYLSDDVLHCVCYSLIKCVDCTGPTTIDEIINRVGNLLPVRLVNRKGLHCRNVKNLQYYTQKMGKMFGIFKNVMLMFLNSNVCLQNMVAMHNAGAFVPVDFIVASPWEEYETNSFLFKKNDATQVFVNIHSQKETDKIFTYKTNFFSPQYSLSYSVVTNEQVVIKEDVEVFVRGGCSTKFISKEKDLQIIQTSGGLEKTTRSLMSFMIPVQPLPKSPSMARNPIDIRGFHANFADVDYASSEVSCS